MTPSDQVISLSAAFIAGVTGSAHCVAMCGGLAGALGMRARAQQHAPQRVFASALLTNIGRVGSYTLVGAIVGAIGSGLATLMDWLHLAAWLRGLAGVLLLAVAVRIVFGWNAFAWLERGGALLWSRIFAPRAQHAAQGIGAAQSLLLGVAWGWLPCGLVYSMALYAALAGDAVRGASIMVAFGIGTLPSMLSSTLLGSQLARLFKYAATRWVAGAILIALGIWTILSALRHSGHH